MTLEETLLDSNVQASSLKCKNIITRAFAPHIAVTASQDAEDLCQSMGFNGFLDLLQPLGDKVAGRVTVRDSQALSMPFDDFSVRFIPPPRQQDLPQPQQQSPKSPPNSAFAGTPKTSDFGTAFRLFQKQALDEYIAKLTRQQNNSDSSTPLTKHHDIVYLDVFQKLLSAIPVSPFETFSHPVAGIVAISSNNHQPIETLSALYNESHDSSVPEYVNKEYLRYYVLIHDEQTDLNTSIALFEKMKRHFGLQCHMVRINRKVDEADGVLYPRSEWLSFQQESAPATNKHLHPDDIASLTAMVRELVVQSVVPFMERCITAWNDQYASSRRGIAGRFFSASRKYFGSNNKNTSLFGQSSPFSQGSGNTSSASTGNFNPSTLTYGYLSPEALLRKLADFAFMLRDYKFAYSTYELLKRDFTNDKAWGYLAASQEMCAVSYLLSSEGNSLTIKSRTDVIEFMLDQSTYSYISRCSMPSYALRCILLSSELMCTTKSPTAASEGSSRWILKALNEKLVGPLGSALLLERVSKAYSCHGLISHKNSEAAASRAAAAAAAATESDSSDAVAGKRPKNTRDRKAAFWMLLAAREWATTTTTTGETSLFAQSKDCLELADQVYGDLEWAQRPGTLLGKLVAAIEESEKTQQLSGKGTDDGPTTSLEGGHGTSADTAMEVSS